MKKIISIILAVALLAVPFCGINASAADEFIGKELVVNGGFDNNGENWTLHWGPATIINADSSFAGNRTDACLQIPNYSGGASSNSFELKGGYIYTLSFLIAARDGTLGKNLVIVSIGNLLNETYKSVNFNYERVTYTFECKEDTTANIRFNRQDFAGGAGVCIDDVSLVATESTDPAAFVGKELIVDGGFDRPLGETWENVWNNNAKIVELEGDNCIEIPNWSGGIDQSVALRGGYFYKLTFSYASGAASGETNGISVSLGNLVPKEVYKSTTYGFITVTYEFECKTDTTADIWFRTDVYGNTRPQHIDDVSLVATDTTDPALYIGRELIVNGGFNGDFTGWSFPWGSTDSSIIAATSDYGSSKAGDNCLQLGNYAGGPAQNVKLRGGFVYNLSFLIAARDAELGKTLMNVKFGEFVNAEYVSVNFNYEKVTYTFECKEDTTVNLWLFRGNYASKPISIDDVSITPIATINDYYAKYLVSELVTNGDFSNGSNGWKTSYVGIKDYPHETGKKELMFWFGGDGYASTDVTVEAGKTYKVSFAYRKGNTAPLNYSVLQNDEAIFEGAIPKVTSQNYHTAVSFKFTAVADGVATIKFASNPQDTLSFITDVSVVPATSAKYENIVADGTLEDPKANGWTLGWNTSAYNDGAGSVFGTANNNIIKFGEYASPVWTDINVEKGQTYKISFDWAPYWKTVYDLTSASIAINIYDKADNTKSILSVTELTKSTTAYKVEYNFTSTFTGTATVRLGRDGGHQWWVTYVDNVAVYPMTYENAVVNGTFETAVAPAAALGAFAESDDYYGWCLDGAAEISDIAKNGLKALKVANTDGAYATAYVANPKNALAFNYKGEAESSARVVVSSDFEGTNVLATKDVVGTGDWAEYVVNTDLAVGKVYIHIISTQGTNYFDDVSIISYELIANKDFAPKSDDNYIFDVSGADIKAGYKGYNAELTVSSDEMKTGVKATLSINGKFIAWEKEIVVSGDANGDGVSSVHDLVAAKKQASGVDRLSGAYLRAVTANENGEVQGYDLSVLRNIILDLKVEDVRYIKAAKKELYAETDKNPLSYTIGDDIVFNVALYADGKMAACPEFSWEAVTDAGKSYKGKANGLLGKFDVTIPATDAGYVRLKVSALDEQGNLIDCVNQVDHLNGPALFSAGVDVDSINFAKAMPSDFDAVWAAELSKLDETAPDLLKYELLKEDDNFYYYIVKIQGNDDIGFTSAYLTYPKNAEAKSLKLRVVSFHYGSFDVSPLAAEGMATLSIAPHSIELQQDDAYYAEMEKQYADYGFSGNETFQSTYFRKMILRHIQAVRFLKAYLGTDGVMINGEKVALDLWNGADLAVQGASQGGYLSLAIAGLDNDVNEVTVNAPWMCDIGGGSGNTRMRGIHRPGYNSALAYVDGGYLATRISSSATIKFISGLGDYSCPPSGHTAIYNALKDTHNIVWEVIQGKTHGFTPAQADTFIY